MCFGFVPCSDTAFFPFEIKVLAWFLSALFLCSVKIALAEKVSTLQISHGLHCKVEILDSVGIYIFMEQRNIHTKSNKKPNKIKHLPLFREVEHRRNKGNKAPAH